MWDDAQREVVATSGYQVEHLYVCQSIRMAASAAWWWVWVTSCHFRDAFSFCGVSGWVKGRDLAEERPTRVTRGNGGN